MVQSDPCFNYDELFKLVLIYMVKYPGDTERHEQLKKLMEGLQMGKAHG